MTFKENLTRLMMLLSVLSGRPDRPCGEAWDCVKVARANDKGITPQIMGGRDR